MLRDEIAKYMCEGFGQVRGCNMFPRWGKNTPDHEMEQYRGYADEILTLIQPRLDEIREMCDDYYNTHKGTSVDMHAGDLLKIITLCTLTPPEDKKEWLPDNVIKVECLPHYGIKVIYCKMESKEDA